MLPDQTGSFYIDTCENANTHAHNTHTHTHTALTIMHTSTPLDIFSPRTVTDKHAGHAHRGFP